jgi:flagellar biosynthesis protein FlhB
MPRDDKTEKATPKRRQESRKKGQVAKSQDLGGAAVVLAALFALTWIGPAVVTTIASSMRDAFTHVAHSGDITTSSGLGNLTMTIMNTLLSTVGPIAGVCVAVGVIANVAQAGFRPSFTAIKPDFKRVNPASGAKNLFGSRILFELAKSLAKVAVVAIVAAMALIPELTNLGANVGTTPGALGQLMGASAIAIAQRAAIAYLLIGIIDFVYQRHRHEKQLKMSKQEVKDEFKQHALPPEVRAAQRRRQMQIARARMMAAVPQADVVVTNPTHYAVALSYDGTHPAPVLVAKGQGYVALQIRKIAEEHDVVIVPDPPLARGLHASVEVGHMIPEEMYAAVAEVLAYVYRVAGRRKAMAA